MKKVLVEEGRGGRACEEHLLKCQKMGSADERGEEREGREGREEGESKRHNELMSHLRPGRCFQVRSIGSVFHTGASLGTF